MLSNENDTIVVTENENENYFNDTTMGGKKI
jgi:hypothetical protein